MFQGRRRESPCSPWRLGWPRSPGRQRSRSTVKMGRTTSIVNQTRTGNRGTSYTRFSCLCTCHRWVKIPLSSRLASPWTRRWIFVESPLCAYFASVPTASSPGLFEYFTGIRTVRIAFGIIWKHSNGTNCAWNNLEAFERYELHLEHFTG